MDVRSLKVLDRELAPKYLAKIQLEDKAGNTGTSTLTIIVTDVNDNKNYDVTQHISVYNYKGITLWYFFQSFLL